MAISDITTVNIVLKPTLKPVLSNIFDTPNTRYAYNMDGTDDRWTLANRAINPDGDIDIEFYAPSSFGVLQQVISQNVATSSTAIEFGLEFSATGTINFRLGGSTLTALTVAQGSEPATLFRVQLIDTSFKIWKTNIADTDTPIRTASFTRGLVREPLAQTVIGAYTNGVTGTYTRYFFGIQRDVKINGALWKMDQRNQAVQPSEPAGNNMTGANLNPDRWVEIPK